MKIIENTNLDEKLPQVRVTTEMKRDIVEIAGEEQKRTGKIVKISDIVREFVKEGLAKRRG